MEKHHQAKDLDLTCGRRGVWLVKVPKYLSDSWKTGKAGMEVGKLKIVKKDADTKEVTFCSNQALHTDSSSNGQAPPNDKVTSRIPPEHKFSLIPLGPQKLCVLSTELIPDTSSIPQEDPLNEGEEGEEKAVPDVCEGKFSLVGTVIQRAECRPMNNDALYMSHIRKSCLRLMEGLEEGKSRTKTRITYHKPDTVYTGNRMENSNRPVNGIIQLDKTVISYKPVSAHQHNLEADSKKKSQGKMVRSDEAEVKAVLFAAFEKYQYYNVKDLVRITKQPITFLKEILKEICLYNMKAPNKNTWELKPEYRHYKQDPNAVAAVQAQHDDNDDDDDDDDLEAVDDD